MTFRAILAEVDAFPSHGGPPRDLHRLEFARTVPFEPRELRRLTQAADFARSLIGVRADAAGRLSIWGLIHQGPRWLQDVVGGRGGRATLPPVPVVHVVAPGSVEARCGPELVGRLEPGKLSGTRFDVFEARWLPRSFQHLQDEQRRMYEGALERREAMGEQWPPLDPDLPRHIGERVMKRAIAVLRRERRGGTILGVPLELANELGAGTVSRHPVSLRGGGRATAVLRVMVSLLARLALVHGGSGSRPLSWDDFESATDDELAALDEALFEFAHLIADLAAVDGAVGFE